jgi:hypothetical protein
MKSATCALRLEVSGTARRATGPYPTLRPASAGLRHDRQAGDAVQHANAKPQARALPSAGCRLEPQPRYAGRPESPPGPGRARAGQRIALDPAGRGERAYPRPGTERRADGDTWWRRMGRRTGRGGPQPLEDAHDTAPARTAHCPRGWRRAVGRRIAGRLGGEW